MTEISDVPYSVFEAQLDSKNIQNITLRSDSAIGFFKIPPPKETTYDAEGRPRKPRTVDGKPETYNKQFYVELPADPESQSKLLDRIRALKAQDPELLYDVVPGSPTEQVYWLIYLGLGVATVVLLWTMLRRSRDQMMGGGFLSSFARSTAKRYEAVDKPVTFEDVAGLESVKADLQEIVEFLKAPEKFRKLGGRVPKGVLLNGPLGPQKHSLLERLPVKRGRVLSVNGSEFYPDVRRGRCQPCPRSLSASQRNGRGDHLHRRDRRCRSPARRGTRRDTMNASRR